MVYDIRRELLEALLTTFGPTDLCSMKRIWGRRAGFWPRIFSFRTTCSRGEPVCDHDESDGEQPAEYQGSSVERISGGAAVLQVAEGKQASQINSLTLQMTRSGL